MIERSGADSEASAFVDRHVHAPPGQVILYGILDRDDVDGLRDKGGARDAPVLNVAVL